MVHHLANLNIVADSSPAVEDSFWYDSCMCILALGIFQKKRSVVNSGAGSCRVHTKMLSTSSLVTLSAFVANLTSSTFVIKSVYIVAGTLVDVADRTMQPAVLLYIKSTYNDTLQTTTTKWFVTMDRKPRIISFRRFDTHPAFRVSLFSYFGDLESEVEP